MRSHLGSAKALQQFLKESSIRKAPILLLSSQPQQQVYSKHVDETCRYIQFLLAQQMNLRTVACHTSTGRYPTTEDPQQLLELAGRTGASTIVAVGSGTAMDLAKAIRPHVEHTLLVPATYAAVLVAGSSRALLLDTKEEALVVSPPWQSSSSPPTPTTIVADSKYLDPKGRVTAALAAVSVILDSLIHDKTNDVETLQLLESVMASIATFPGNKMDQLLIDSLLTVSTDLFSYGVDAKAASLPLSLAASLAATVFPQHDLLSLMARVTTSLLPVARQHLTTETASTLDSIHDRHVPTIATTESVDNLLKLVRANRALWNRRDRNNHDLIHDILQDLTLVSNASGPLKRSYRKVLTA